MKNSRHIIFLLLICVINVSCTKDDFCNNKSLCDLLSNTILPAAGVLIGVDLSIVSSVYNVAASTADCTEDASASRSLFDVEYRLDEGQPWGIVSNASNQVLNVNSLSAGSAADENQVLLNFNQAGQYRFRTEADYELKIDERDDSNNGSCAGCRVELNAGNNISYSEVLTVYENPNIKIDPAKPQVEIVSIKKIN